AQGEQIYSVSRAELNKILLDVAEDADEITLHFGQQVLGYDPDTKKAQMRDVASDRTYDIDASPLIAADGGGSPVRRAFDHMNTIRGTEHPLEHGYKELTIPPAADGSFQLEPNALHIWPRGGFMLIALPNPGGDFTLTLFMSVKGDPGFESWSDEASARAFFETHFPDAVPLMPDFVDEALNNPLGFLGTIRCEHWHDGGNVLLIGDAAHAIVPFHGQGMNLAFEDCVVLEQIIRHSDGDWADIFERFEQEQRPNANAIADMALENYVEMRDTVRDPKYVLRKELAFELERRVPDYFIPRYSMVMFHAEIPYSVVQQRGEVQYRLLEEFTADAASLDEVDIDAAARAATERLPPVKDVSVDRTA
ncbi:MAG: NAD(P)/FAD-dependent oxidoreductase, partial [Woeseiaceae bacterium]|nr:NAD(P)/FAD-dependent oxidoreductase [Woeseiaceae bacterium]